MRQCLLVLAALTLAPALFAEPRVLSRRDVEEVASRVVAALSQRVEKPVKELEQYSDDVESYSFTETMESVSEVRITSWKVIPEWGPSGTVTAHLTLQAAARAWDGKAIAFPSRWTVRIAVAGGRPIVTALANDEGETAYQMLSPQSDEMRECLLDGRADLDASKVIKYLADDLASPSKADGFEDAFVFAFQWARRHGATDVENTCATLASTRALMRGELPLAIALAESAADSSDRIGDAEGWTAAKFARGIAEWRFGMIEDALSSLRAASDRFPDTHKRLTALKANYMEAYISEARGDARPALEAADRLTKRSRAIGWSHGETLADWIVGNVEGVLHNDALAREYHGRIYATLDRAGDQDEAALVLADVARDEAALGNRTVARDIFRKALRRMRQLYWAVPAAASLADILVELRDYGEAQKILDASEGIPTPDSSLRSYTALARSRLAYDRGRFGDAERFARQAIALTASPGQIDIYRTMWPAQTALARALVAAGRPDEAETAYRDAIATIEAESGGVASDDLSRFHLYDDRVAPYRGLAELFAHRQKPIDALAMTEAVRARALREIIEQGRVDRDALLSPDEKATKRALERALTEKTRAALGTPAAAPARHALDEARLALENLNSLAAVRHGRTYHSMTPRSEDLRAIPLHEDEVVIEYLVGERETLAFIVSAPKGQTHIRVRKLAVGARRLRTMTSRLANAIRQRDMRWAHSSSVLYDAVLGPLFGPHFPRHICVIPDGDLWSVPFEVLRDRDGRTVIERASVSYSPSLLILRDTRRADRVRSSRVLLAFGNPIVNGGTAALVRSLDPHLPLGPLPEAEREVQRLRDLYGTSHADVHVGADARESLFKREAGNYRILHVATHGMVDDRSPMYSCLVLTADGHDDGLLEMREIVNLDLHADLAVLSSCDTARGRVSRGEGVVGIAWAFLAAGCPTTVVSQWKVDSAATERLMVAFHRDFIESGLASAADALRRAQLALMKDPRYRHPYYWAPFVVVGNP